MRDNELISALEHLKVETGSLVCLDCGHAYGCGFHGCAIIREAAARIKALQEENRQIRETCFSVSAVELLEAELTKVTAERDALRADETTVLAMAAGARSIENNIRLWGVSYIWDCFGETGGPKEISYYEAAQRLRAVSEPILSHKEGGGKE